MSTVLLLALLALQAETPEASKKEPSEGEVIRDKVRRAISSNATVRFTVTTENRSFRILNPDGPQGAQVLTQVGGASVDLRPGNRLKIDGRFPIRDLKWRDLPNGTDSDWMVLESDGSSISVTPYSKSIWAKAETPKTLNQDLLQDILLLGVRTAVVERLKTLTPLED